MRLVLEKADLIKILEKQFSMKLEDSLVLVRTEPSFEVEISGLPLSDSALEGDAEAPKPKVSKPVEPTPEDYSGGLKSGWTVTPPSVAPEPTDRVLGVNASHEPPPYDELAASAAILAKMKED